MLIRSKKSDNVGPLRRVLAVVMVTGLLAAAASASVETDRPLVAEPESDSGLSAYTMGVFLLESGSARKAIAYLETAWEKSNHDPTIGAKLADAYFRVGEFSTCEVILDSLIAIEGDVFGPLFMKARILYLQNDKKRAVDYLLRLRDASEPTFDVERTLATIFKEIGRYEDALDAYERAGRLNNFHASLFYDQAKLLQQFGRTDKAIGAFQNALKIEPEFTEACIDLVNIYVGRDRIEDAEAVLLANLRADENGYEVLGIISRLYIDQGRANDAVALLDSRGDRSDLPHDLVLLLGRAYYEIENYDEALAVFEGLFVSNDGSPELARVLGEISLKAGDTKIADGYFRRAIAMGPEDYRNYLALFFAASPDFAVDGTPVIQLPPQESVELLDTAASKVTGDDFDAYYLIGMSYQSLNALDEAQSHLERAVELNPENERAILNYVSVLEKLKRYEEGAALLEKLHERSPDDPTVCNFYGYILALLGRELDLAERLIRTALETDPENGYYTDSLGWVFYRKGRFGDAVRELESAVELAGEDPVILEHLGDAYRSMNRYDEALDAYEKSNRRKGDNPEVQKKIEALREQKRN